MACGTWQGSGTWKTTGGGSGGLVLAVIVAALLIGSGAASAIASAVVTIAIVIACLAAAAVLGGVALLVYRVRWELKRSDRPGRPVDARPVYQLPPESRPQLEESHKPAIGPGHEIHLHLNVSLDELAAILGHHKGS